MRTRIVGVLAAIISPIIFSLSIPFSAKFFLDQVHPWFLAGALDLSAGLGMLVILLLFQRTSSNLRTSLQRADLGNLVIAIGTGGIIAPVLFMISLTGSVGSSMLLVTETLFTALFAWKFNGERITPLTALTIFLISISSAILASAQFNIQSFAAAGAALAYAFSHVYTARIADRDPLQVGTIKLLISGVFNVLTSCLVLRLELPSITFLGSIFAAGIICNGVSYLLFLLGIRQIGAARAGALYSLIPVFGGIFLVFLGEPFTENLKLAGLFMVGGLGLLVWQSFRESE